MATVRGGNFGQQSHTEIEADAVECPDVGIGEIGEREDGTHEVGISGPCGFGYRRGVVCNDEASFNAPEEIANGGEPSVGEILHWMLRETEEGVRDTRL